MGSEPGALPTEDEPPTSERDGPLRAAADAVLGELERVLHAYVARLRSDPSTPSAHGAAESQVEDHLASFLADLAGSLHHLDSVDLSASGEPTPAIRDATAIQRVVAERHGAQRARLGWAEQELRREFTILREELEAAIRRRAPSLTRGPTLEARRGDVERALEVLNGFLALAERMSMTSFQKVRAARQTSEHRSDR
jgi:hypothetical protein